MRAGLFLAVRLGVTPNLLQNIASENPADIEAIWQTAIEIWQETASPKITGAVLAAAIVKQLPQHDALLANMKIDFQDVLEGIR